MTARLHVLGPWHGPGEEKAARRLAADLPDGWDVVAGRMVPTDMGPVDLDLVVVGRNAVFVCEEKAWGPHVVTGEVSWFSNGDRRHNPVNQVGHAAKVLAGRLKLKVPGWSKALRLLSKGRRPVHGHVVLSHSNLILEDHGDLGADAVLRLADTADVLAGLDAAFPTVLSGLRQPLVAFLLGLDPQPDGDSHPKQIMQYTILDPPIPHGAALAYPARTPARENAFLFCVQIDGVENPESARRLAVQEHDALAALARKERTWRVQGWFDWEAYRVTPVIVEMDGTSLRKLALTRQPEHVDGRVPADIGAAVVNDALTALAEVHGEGVLHRALHLPSVEVTPENRVRFRDFGRSRVPSEHTIAPLLDDDHPSAGFRAPGATLEMFTEADDVYSLALCLVQWLHGDASDTPDHDLARERATGYPVVGRALARCLSRTVKDRPAAAAAAAETRPAEPQPDPVVMREGALLDERYRLIRVLGQGAWATTWLAFNEVLGVHRALKHPRPDRVAFEDVKSEFTAAWGLRSFHCARVDDLLKNPEPGVLVQEYVPGMTLHELAASGGLDREQARRIAVDVLTGLADAHDRGLLHRDVSPNNVIVRDDGRAVLIDFGLAARVENAQSAVGSPPYTAPEVWLRHEWSPAADIYSAGASVLQAMLGRLPYAGPAIAERTTLVRPSAADEERFGHALLAALYRAVEPESGARPQDARAFAHEVLRASDIAPPPGDRIVNPTVDALRGFYRHSRIGNAGNRGMDDAFAIDTYAPTGLDSHLLPAIVDGRIDVLVLSGNPGDGKTSFLVQVGAKLDEKGAVTVASDAAGWRKRLAGRTFAAVYDASESHGALTSDALIRSALDPGGDDPAHRTVLIAANDGRIAQFFGDHAERYPEIARELVRQRTEPPAPDARIVLVDLKRRALALPDLDGPALGAGVLGQLTALHRWDACRPCTAREVCPIRGNAERLRGGQARRAVAELLLTSHLRRRRRATVRDVRSAFSWIITGDLSCGDVHDEIENSRNPAAGRTTYELAFDPASRDYLVQEWAELDPARLAAPGAARAARAQRGLVPDLVAMDPPTMSRLKRALFFGEWSAPGVRHEVRSYRHLDAYLAALADPASALPLVLRGISRVLAYVGYRETDGLALRDRVFDDPAVRSIVVVKELPADEFTLQAATAAAPYVESFPDLLELRHRAGARLQITLDTAELLLRAADGEVLGDTASAALRKEIAGFGDRLRLEPAPRVRIVNGAGRAIVATVTADGRITAGRPS